MDETEKGKRKGKAMDGEPTGKQLKTGSKPKSLELAIKNDGHLSQTSTQGRLWDAFPQGKSPWSSRQQKRRERI